MNTETLEMPQEASQAEAHTFALTPDQQEALDAFYRFLMDPLETVFVLSGYSGCGKSTLVHTLLDRLPGFMKMLRLVNADQFDYEPVLTATTNKAAENLAFITGHEVKTIHSHLGLRVSTDWKTGETSMVASPRNIKKYGQLLFIDEASYIDRTLLEYIFQFTENCKVVFIGDPAQLAPVKAVGTPVFDANFPGAALTQVVRQAEGNPIVDLATKFRGTVNSGEFFSFTPDGHHIQYLDRQAFNAAIQKEFSRPDWKYRDSKILAYRNACVIGFNKYVRNHVKGDPHFEEGDYAVCNSFLSVAKKTIKTDQLVQITKIWNEQEYEGVLGRYYEMDHTVKAFQPNTLQAKNERLKRAQAQNDFALAAEIETSWVDLRAAYACTINKSQGSTYDAVFIDLDDVRTCTSGDQIARMLYVAVSRARNHVYLTGDLC